MARPYPRFIYADPKDTKSTGPFIVHTLHPQLIAKVSFTKDGFHQVDHLSAFTPTNDVEIDEVIYAMYNWYTAKRMKESSLSSDFYERASTISTQISKSRYFDSVSIFSTFIPTMGARLGVEKDNWTVEIWIANEDTYHSTVKKLKEEFHRKYGKFPDWPIQDLP